MADDPVNQMEERLPTTARPLIVLVLMVLLLVVAAIAHRASQSPVNRLKRQLDNEARSLDWQINAQRTAPDGPSQGYWARESEKTAKKIDVLKASIAETEGQH